MLGTSLDGLKEKNGELVNANGDVVSSLSDIRKSADGTREGIAILNGTPCEVKVNKDGTIADLRAIDEEQRYESEDAVDHISNERNNERY